MAKDLQILAPLGFKGTPKTKVINGIERLGQKFILELLTEIGSMQYLPERGSHFLPRLRRIRITEFSILASFAAARQEIKRNLRKDETARTRLSERLKHATVHSIHIEDDAIRLGITIHARDDSTLDLVTPSIKL